MPTTDNPQRRIRFDGTINLGHILTFIGFIATGVVTWSIMDRRVTVLEEARIVQSMTDKRQDEDRQETKLQMRDNFKEIDRKLDRLIERGMK